MIVPAMSTFFCIAQMCRCSIPGSKESKHSQIWAKYDSCWESDLQETCSSRHVGDCGWVKEMEKAFSENRMSAQWCDFCIAIQLINWPSCDESICGGWLKNVMSMFPSLGALILAAKLPKYLLIPWYLSFLRARRVMCSLGRGKPTGAR